MNNFVALVFEPGLRVFGDFFVSRLFADVVVNRSNEAIADLLAGALRLNTNYPTSR
jgi:hypothetical protein